MLIKAVLVTGAALLGGASLFGRQSVWQGADGGVGSAVAFAAPPVTGDTAQVRLAVSGMTCGSCATTARIALERAPGVYDAKVSYDSASAVVLYDPKRTSPERFIAHLEKMTGYKARVVEPSEKPKETP